MKKLLTIVLALALVLALSVPALANDGFVVYVSIANGDLVLTREAVSVVDIDGDDTITINDALYCAHNCYFEGGAEAGYEATEGEWGLGLTKLWGVENGGSYGYYVNGVSAWSLTDPLQEKDHVYAFIYTDTETWSDAFSFFDQDWVETVPSVPVELTLSYAGFDDDWNSVTLPVEGAEILIDGEPTGVFTDAEGKATVFFNTPGKAVVSAKSESMTLVPPVCVADVGTPAGGLISPAPVSPAPSGNTYTVKAGDCLWHIAELLTGKGWKYKALYEANKDIISNPDLIYVGQTLILPW